MRENVKTDREKYSRLIYYWRYLIKTIIQRH